MDEIFSKFESRGIKRGGLLFLKPQDAIDLIETARQQNKPILGVDVFRVTGTVTQPSMEHSVDYSNQLASIDTWSAARSHIDERRDKGLLFEVTI